MVSGRCHRWSWEGVWSVAVAATTSGAAGFYWFWCYYPYVGFSLNLPIQSLSHNVHQLFTCVFVPS